MNKMLLFCYSMHGGGTEKLCQMLANEFVEINPNVNILLIHKKGIFLKQIDNRIKVFKLNSILIRFRFLGLLLAYMRAVMKIKPNLVIAFGEWPNVLAPVANFLLLKPHRVVVSEHSIKTLINEPKIYKSNGFISSCARYALNKSDYVVAVSEAVKKNIIKYVPRLNVSIKVIHNGVDLQMIHALAREETGHKWINEKSDQLVFVAVGRLCEEKNYPMMMRSIKIAGQERSVRLLVLGDGPLRDELIAYSKQLNLDCCVEFLGFQSNPYKYLARADALLHASNYEGFGNVFVESLACGTPILTTNCNTPPEIMTHPAHGMIVDLNNADALAAGIILTNKRNYSVSELCLNRAHDFDIRIVAAKYMDIIRLF